MSYPERTLAQVVQDRRDEQLETAVTLLRELADFAVSPMRGGAIRCDVCGVYWDGIPAEHPYTDACAVSVAQTFLRDIQ